MRTLRRLWFCYRLLRLEGNDRLLAFCKAGLMVRGESVRVKP